MPASKQHFLWKVDNTKGLCTYPLGVYCWSCHKKKGGISQKYRKKEEFSNEMVIGGPEVLNCHVTSRKIWKLKITQKCQ